MGALDGLFGPPPVAMTVAELIEKLRALPLDVKVFMWAGSDYGRFAIDEVITDRNIGSTPATDYNGPDEITLFLS